MREIQAALPRGTMIHGYYIIESLLGKGVFGNVYLVQDQRDKQKLFAIAELINPNEQEEYRFTLEYVSLTPLDHRVLPQAQYVFNDEKLGRAYLLVSYIEDPNLEILRLQQPGKCFRLPQVMTIMAPIMDALTYLHHQHPPIIHGNIQPANIIVPPMDDEPVLIILGIVKENDSTTTTVHYFAPGYGAIEQYNGDFSTRTDIYGLGATFYTLLTGIVPVDALYRLTRLSNGEIDPLKPVNEAIPTISTFIAQAIQRAMSISGNDRFSSVEEFWQALNGYPIDQRLSELDAAPSTSIAQQLSEPDATSSTPPPLPVVTKKAIEKPIATPVSKQSHVIFSRKLSILSLILLALTISIVFGVSFWLYAVGYHRPGLTTPTAVLQNKSVSPSKPTPESTPTSSLTSSIHLDKLYNGTIYNIPANITTKMSLMGVQQSKEQISGYFIGNHVNGSFTGSIDASKHIQFIIQASTGSLTLSFEGGMRSDGSLAGSYCSLDSGGQCTDEYGLWSVAPCYSLC